MTTTDPAPAQAEPRRRLLSLPALSNPLRPLLLAAGRSQRLKGLVTGLPVTRKVVRRYVPGEAQEAVVAVAREILASGRAVSVDHLGEDTSDPAQAESIVQAYLAVLRAFGELDAPAVGQLVGVEPSPEPVPGPRGIPQAFAAFAACFCSCLNARTSASDSGPVMSATERRAPSRP